MVTHEDDRRLRPRIEELRDTVRTPAVADQDQFRQIFEGWIELANEQLVDVSLLQLEVRARRAPDPSALAALLVGTLRQGDVIGHARQGGYAVLLDAGATGALRVAGRVKRALEGVPEVEAIWVGVATAAPPVRGPEGLQAMAAGALERAKALPYGWIESSDLGEGPASGR